ncbi:glutamate--tRNA ligase [Aestuariirhabdus sp. Z084]|uniref:glutamate--tRNA ligase n=1 Tax=Aestuariirhabdus haliotis TaxID=2918751 RepID=UPI00201B35E6|nr:glutamate--tRNA ligase [Aestuariirhabdus haliotis]MCL6414666.1 glutamate--tRNA ligase [Aestuariirhabdus haliotis]MCL6418352.1 glutamate--tRNA ligase [Aestuariirhabdus haliotis]
MTVRTRIAPSPTGDPHVGTAYIALFNYCFARQHGGEFILRVEDTDQLRSTPESEQMILDSLRWLGIDWDEGPDCGGESGPYRQSDRADIYQRYAQQLIEQGDAFYCFATPQELDEMRKEQQARGERPKYDGRGLLLSAEEVKSRLAAGDPYVVRMKIPEEGSFRFNDYLRGDVEIPWEQIDMQVLLKQDGLPTYFLANVVDDHLMGITHVFRGEEWLPSAPKLIKLYEYFGWEAPVLGHMPLLRNPDKSKLSKRKNPTSILYYQRMGYLPEALINYLGRMGWSMPDEREKFSLDEMIASFDMKRVSLGGPIFDPEKLDWLNGQWIRDDLNDDQFIEALKTWAFNDDYIRPLIPHLKGRVERFSQVAPLASFMFAGMAEVTEAQFDELKLERDEIRRVLQFVSWYLDELRVWDKDAIFAGLKALAKAMDVKMGGFMPPIFLSIAGTTSTFSIVDAMQMLGPDLSRARVRYALNLLGSASKKEAKRWDKEYRALER